MPMHYFSLRCLCRGGPSTCDRIGETRSGISPRGCRSDERHGRYEWLTLFIPAQSRILSVIADSILLKSQQTAHNAIFPAAKTIIPINPLLIMFLFHLVFFLGSVLFFLSIFFPVWSVLHPPSQNREKGCDQDTNRNYDFFLHFLLLFLPVMSPQVSRRHHK